MQIPKELREELKGLKKYERETYAEVIRRKMKKDLAKVRKQLEVGK